MAAWEGPGVPRVQCAPFCRCDQQLGHVPCGRSHPGWGAETEGAKHEA